MPWKILILASVFVLTSHACIQSLDGWKQVGLEERAKRSPVVFHGLAIEATPEVENSYLYSVEFWMINVYKGSDAVADLLNLEPGSGGVFNLRDRRINVTGFGDKSKCHGSVIPQKYYIIFCEVRENGLVAKFDDLFGAAADWSEKNEERVWHGIGWENWSDWGACGASCGEGSQERVRKCILGERNCHGYNKERRRCNMFSCQGAVNPMKLEDTRFFHLSGGEWEKVPSRPTAWKLRPNSYFWVPSSQIFPKKSSHRTGMFPREFTLLVTLKLNPSKPVQGTLFSLRSRRQQDAYLSLELEAEDRIRIVHAGKNGTQAVVIPMELNDGHWHQLGLALQDDNSVRSFLDCAWVSTDILKRNGLDHPEDADLIIGYLFQGELEQMVIVPNPSAVAQQCSSSRIPLYDPVLESDGPTQSSLPDFSHFHLKNERRGEITLVRKNEDYDAFEGSGNGYNETNYEVEWSDWSECSASCGPGTQTRYSRCVDDGSRLELCMEAGGERTETRSCLQLQCENDDLYFSQQRNQSEILIPMDLYLPKNQSGKKHSKHRKNKSEPWKKAKASKKPCPCLNGGTCRGSGIPCSCPEGYRGKRCEKVDCQIDCLNGGRCLSPNVCTCTANYIGARCEDPVCDPPCQNGGTCLKPNVCLCPTRTSGSYCQIFSCRTKCLNGGSCVGPDQCECPHNATGSSCQNPICEPPCENGATCSPGNWCLCDANSYGIRCERRKCEYLPVREPYTRGFRRLVSKKVEAKCEPWTWKTCVRNVPEYQTVYKTFYRTVYKCKEKETEVGGQETDAQKPVN